MGDEWGGVFATYQISPVGSVYGPAAGSLISRSKNYRADFDRINNGVDWDWGAWARRGVGKVCCLLGTRQAGQEMAPSRHTRYFSLPMTQRHSRTTKPPPNWRKNVKTTHRSNKTIHIITKIFHMVVASFTRLPDRSARGKMLYISFGVAMSNYFPRFSFLFATVVHRGC